jgi:hypothetical protein
MPKPVVHNVKDILDLLQKEVDADELDPEVAGEYREDLREFITENEPPTYSFVPTKHHGKSKGPPRNPQDEMKPHGQTKEGPDQTVPIKEEPDSLIGSDGKKIDNYIQNEQNAVSKPLSQDLGDNYIDQQINTRNKTMSEEFGEDFLGASDSESDYEVPDMGGTDTNVQAVGTKRGWYDFKRYTKGKYKKFEGTYEIDAGEFDDDLSDTESELSLSESEIEASRVEGQVRVPVVEPKEVDPYGGRLSSEDDLLAGGQDDGGLGVPPQEVEPVIDINSPVPKINPLDGDPDDPFAAEPEYDPFVRPSEEAFSWSKPKTWWRRQPKNNDLGEPLLGRRGQGNEMVDMSGADRGTYNLPFAERPGAQELSPQFTDEARVGLNELITDARGNGWSDSAIASEMGIGVSAGGGMWISRATLKEYMIKQGKGLLVAPIMVGLTMLLNYAVPGLGDTISLGLVTADLLMTGDPLGVIIYGVGQLWDAANKSRQKVIDNDKPDKDYGSRIGYVREGDTWYPAIYNQKYKSTGLWAGDQQITLDYGSDIVWRVDGEGRFVPMIPDSKSKNYVATDDEFQGKTKFRGGGALLSSQEFITEDVFQSDERVRDKMLDSVRDWYFLDKDDTKKVMSGEMELSAYTDDYTQMNSSARQLNDWRKALDFSQDWKWSSAIQTMGPGAAVNNYAGSRGLQRQMYEGVKWGDTGVWISKEQDYDKYISDYANRQGDTWDSGHGVHHTFKNYLMDTVLKDHIATLYRVQLEAAQEAGFDKLYQTEVGAAMEKNDPGRTLAAGGGTPWSALYLDTAKDMPVAADAEELAQQMHEIELLNDRTPLQRNYLAQKVQTRYWMQQIVSIGQASELQEWVQEGKGHEMGGKASSMFSWYSFQDEKGRTPEEAVHRWNYEGDYLGPNQNWDLGYAMPWQNAGESYLPDLTGALAGTSAKDYMSSYRSKAYDRLTQEAQENTVKWINATGKLDPNLKIEGIDYNLQEGGIYFDSDRDSTNWAWDEYAGTYVGPGGNSEWTEYNPETGDYELTDEGEHKKRQEEGEAEFEEWKAKQDADRDKREREWLDTHEGGFMGIKEDPDVAEGDAADEAIQQKILEGEDIVDKDPDVAGAGGFGAGEDYGHDFRADMQYRKYDVPEGWRWDYAQGQDAEMYIGGIYYSPDGKKFGDDDGPNGPKGMDQDTYSTTMNQYVDILNEAQKRLDDENEKEDADAARKAAEDADLQAYRDVLDRRDAERAEAKERRGEAYLARLAAEEATKRERWARDEAKRAKFEESQKGIRTKSDIEAQKAAFQLEDDAAIEDWRKLGVKLGFLDDDFEPITAVSPEPSPVRPTQTNSHVPDAVVPDEDQDVEHVVGDHAMHSYSAGALGVLSMWGGHAIVQHRGLGPRQGGAVKVV